MSEMRFLDYYGVALPKLEDDHIPLGAVVALKSIDKDGRIVYQEFKSPEIHAIEALGMLDTFTDTMRHHIMGAAKRAE